MGFEPTARITTSNTLAGCRFQPLIQPSYLVPCEGIEPPSDPCKGPALPLDEQGVTGVPPGSRTPANGFGDRCATVTLERHCLVEEVRFELTEPFGSSVFKTGAISQALPLFQKIEFVVGR